MAMQITPKQYLCQIERLDSLIQNRQTEISQLWDLATNITAPSDSERVQTSGSKDRVGDIVSRICNLENEKNEFIDSYMAIKNFSISSMEKMEDLRYYRILFKKYIEYKSLSDIAASMNYSYRQTKRLHGEALQKFSDIVEFESCPHLSPNVHFNSFS